ncbi:MAG: DUF4340 domain-containing protein [Candidatus Cloacimonetes bacterium]|nr:DUF4340 domain-containing protein [Candidatus Cloacimonadota bacterium]
MNKKRSRILLIALVLLLALFFLLRFLRPEERTRNVIDLKSGAIDRILIWDNMAKLELKRDGERWMLQQPLVWAADSTRVRQFFEKVVSAKYATKAMSIDPNAAENYGLSDTDALHIQLFAGNKNRHLLFSNLGNEWDYFRWAGKSEVYAIKSKVVQHFPPELLVWRSPLILRYYEEHIRSIRSKHKDNDYTLSRQGSSWTYEDKRQKFPVDFDNYALVKIISILQNFNTHIFIDGKTPEYESAFAEPMCEVWITDTDGNTRKLSFAKFDHNRHLLMVDDDNSVLYQVEFDSVYRFMRNPEIFRMIFSAPPGA